MSRPTYTCRIRPPFPAINVTDPFECDQRTKEILVSMFRESEMLKRGYALDITENKPEEDEQ